MNKRIQEFAERAGINAVISQDKTNPSPLQYVAHGDVQLLEKFTKLIVQELHREVIASILITDVVMEAKGQKPTSEDYIRAINKDFGVES